MVYLTSFPSPVGRLTAAGDGDNIVGLWIEGQKYFGATLPADTVINDELPVFSKLRSWLGRYFAGEKPNAAELPLAPVGGDFRQLIWKLLLEIPYGETTTYGALAKKAAEALDRKTMSAQAVGGAIGHNPILIVVPCHRVVGSDGSLTGYAGGMDIKRQLLELESK